MKKIFALLIAALCAMSLWAQDSSVLDQLKADPKKSYGNDYPYLFKHTDELTKAPKGYKPVYISHYSRHGSRYYWNASLYTMLDTLLTKAHNDQLLTAEGEAFYGKFMNAKDELMAGVSELSQLGWEQHQGISRRMYNNFPEVFEKGGNVLAISSLSGRCVLSMASFCQELVQCNPFLEIREQSSRFTLDGVVPTDEENPARRSYPKSTTRSMKNRDQLPRSSSLTAEVMKRTFKEGADVHPFIASSLISLYTSLPNIGHEGMMGNIVTDEEMVERWESSNLDSYAWVFSTRYDMIPVLKDIITKADAALEGKGNVADFRFGHDTCIGPLTVLLGINGADKDPEDPFEVKNIYQNWQTCKACNIQFVFYKGKKATDDVLVKCLLNESEASLPFETDMYPYYRWQDVKDFYLDRCNSVESL